MPLSAPTVVRKKIPKGGYSFPWYAFEFGKQKCGGKIKLRTKASLFKGNERGN